MINFIKKDNEKFVSVRDICNALGISYDTVIKHSYKVLRNTIGNPIEYVYYKEDIYSSYCGTYLLFKNTNVEVNSILKLI